MRRHPRRRSERDPDLGEREVVSRSPHPRRRRDGPGVRPGVHAVEPAVDHDPGGRPATTTTKPRALPTTPSVTAVPSGTVADHLPARPSLRLHGGGERGRGLGRAAGLEVSNPAWWWHCAAWLCRCGWCCGDISSDFLTGFAPTPATAPGGRPGMCRMCPQDVVESLSRLKQPYPRSFLRLSDGIQPIKIQLLLCYVPVGRCVLLSSGVSKMDCCDDYLVVTACEDGAVLMVMCKVRVAAANNAGSRAWRAGVCAAACHGPCQLRDACVSCVCVPGRLLPTQGGCRVAVCRLAPTPTLAAEHIHGMCVCGEHLWGRRRMRAGWERGAGISSWLGAWWGHVARSAGE